MDQRFGGPWTQQKLEVFEKYLRAWLTIFHQNPKASHFQKAYLDGFAGSGSILIVGKEAERQTGSAALALSMTPGFDRYLLVDNLFKNVHELHKLKESLPGLSDKVEVELGDCNSTILSWIDKTDWRRTRALVLLDPFALEVRWSTIEALARTKAVDLWLLFPIMGVNRLLRRKELPLASHESILDRLFGDAGWRTAFYKVADQQGLFDEAIRVHKYVDPKAVAQYFIGRLASIFPGVLKEPLLLKNRMGSPLFCLMFAAANPIGARTAVRIAEDIVAKSLKEN